MDLGEFYPCLNVTDLNASIAFYRKLDFQIVQDNRAEFWAVLRHNNMLLCLFQGHIEQNLINFRGGDVEAIGRNAAERGLTFTKPVTTHPDGSCSAELHDPDGNVIYLDTTVQERERYVRTGSALES